MALQHTVPPELGAGGQSQPGEDACQELPSLPQPPSSLPPSHSPTPDSPGQAKALSVLLQTLATVQALVSGSTHQPGWLVMNSAMQVQEQASSLKFPLTQEIPWQNSPEGNHMSVGGAQPCRGSGAGADGTGAGRAASQGGGR